MGTITSIANSVNSIEKQSDGSSLSSQVLQAIKSAASKTGVDFSYMMKKASQESGFDPSAQSSTSSASGLYQFTSQTWLHMVKTYGADYGLGSYAAQISSDASGHLRVADPVARQAILAMRKDPAVSAEMSCELDKENAASLAKNVGGKIGNTELYLAHFLGAGGASNFISEMRANPHTVGADVLPTAAAANSSVFYTKSGEPRTLQQIYQHFAQKFDSHDTQTANATTGAKTRASARMAGGYSMASADTSLASTISALPTTTGASMAGSNGLQSLTRSAITVASNSSESTFFNTMLLGQIQDSGFSTTSPLGAVNQMDNKKKTNAYAQTNAVG